MRSIRNSANQVSALSAILDHWEMRSIRNFDLRAMTHGDILDHWEMRSIRNSSKSSSQYIPRFICFR